MPEMMDYPDLCRIEQYGFVMFYRMDNYPEDFDYMIENPENQENQLDISAVKSNHHQEPSTNSFGHPSTTQSIILTTTRLWHR